MEGQREERICSKEKSENMQLFFLTLLVQKWNQNLQTVAAAFMLISIGRVDLTRDKPQKKANLSLT